MNELIGSLRRDKMDEFKTKFRNIDILSSSEISDNVANSRRRAEMLARVARMTPTRILKEHI